jgi:hypothetical protein
MKSSKSSSVSPSPKSSKSSSNLSSSSSSSSSPKSSSKSSPKSSPKSSSYSRRNIFERFGDSSAHIVQKLIDDDIAETLLNNNAGKFKLNKKELDHILQQLINKNTTTTKKYEMVMQKLQYFLGFEPNDAQLERFLYIFKFCMKNRKFSFVELESLLEVMNEKLFNFFAKTIVDKEITDQKDYDQKLSDICNFIKRDYYNYKEGDFDIWILKFLEYCAKHRKFNLKHFKQLSSSIMEYYGNYDYEGVVKNDNIAVFAEKILKKENIDVTETKQNIKKIYKILLNIYHEIFDTILFLIYEENMIMELHYYEKRELTILMDLLIKNINEIIIKFDTNDFQDKEIKDALVLEIESVDAHYNWRSSGKYDGVSPPETRIQRIILGNSDTESILKKHNVHANVEYVVKDFKIVN